MTTTTTKVAHCEVCGTGTPARCCSTCRAKARHLLRQMHKNLNQLLKGVSQGRSLGSGPAMQLAIHDAEVAMFLEWTQYTRVILKTAQACPEEGLSVLFAPKAPTQQPETSHKCHCDFLEMLRNGCKCRGV